MKKQILAILVASSLGLLSNAASAENLLQIYQQAKGYDAQFKAQESGHLAVLEGKQQALAALKPQVGLSGNATYDHQYDTLSRNSTDTRSAKYALQLTKSLYNKSNTANLGRSDALIAQSSATLEANRQDLIIRVAKTYFDILLAQDNVVFAGEEKNAIHHQLEQAQAYFDAGRSAITDVKEAEASYAAVVAQEITAQQQLDIAREQLRVMTGGSYQALNTPRANTPLNMPSPNNMDAWVNLAKQSNHLLQASQKGILAAQKNIDLQRAAKAPTVDLVANHSDSYSDGGIVNNRKLDDTSIGVSLSMPLYTGGAVSSKIRAAQDTFRQAQQTYDLQNRQTEQQVRSAFLTVQSSIAQIQANQQAVQAAQTAAEATQAGFEVGTRTAVDVLTSLRTVFSANRTYASARYSYLLNTLLLRQAAGTLGDKDIVALNSFMTATPKQTDTVTLKDQADPAADTSVGPDLKDQAEANTDSAPEPAKKAAGKKSHKAAAQPKSGI